MSLCVSWAFKFASPEGPGSQGQVCSLKDCPSSAILSASLSIRNAAKMMINSFKVDSRNVHYGEDAISSTYEYQSTDLEHDADGNWTLKPLNTTYHFRTGTRVPKLGWALTN